MLLFWIAAALLSAAAAALVLWRARGTGELLTESPDAAVYRRHLAETDDLKARGLLGDDEWKSARAEAARRLLAAAVPAPAAPAGDPKIQGFVVLAAMLSACALAIGVYALVGSPGSPDQPYAVRLAAWQDAARTNPASLGPAEAAAVLTAMTEAQPDNGEAWSFLGRARAASGDAFGAARAFERAVALRPNSADDWSALGEVLTELNGGQVGANADRAFKRALAIDPRAPGPRYALGRAALAAGRRPEGLKLWREALALLPAGDPRRAALGAEIRNAEAVRPAAPPDAAAIRGMVDGLAARLETAPDDPQGWARLVRAYTVLNDIPARDRALARARNLFKNRPADLAAIEAEAR